MDGAILSGIPPYRPSLIERGMAPTGHEKTAPEQVLKVESSQDEQTV